MHSVLLEAQVIPLDSPILLKFDLQALPLNPVTFTPMVSWVGGY